MNIRFLTFLKLPEGAATIRREVFLNEQKFTEEFDSIDASAVHIVAYENDLAVGTCRVFPGQDKGVYILGRLAVMRAFRGRGIGMRLVKRAEEVAISKGAHSIKLHSQCQAIKFYERCGYYSFGEIEYEEYCPHIWMRKELNE